MSYYVYYINTLITWLAWLTCFLVCVIPQLKINWQKIGKTFVLFTFTLHRTHAGRVEGLSSLCLWLNSSYKLHVYSCVTCSFPNKQCTLIRHTAQRPKWSLCCFSWPRLCASDEKLWLNNARRQSCSPLLWIVYVNLRHSLLFCCERWQ